MTPVLGSGNDHCGYCGRFVEFARLDGGTFVYECPVHGEIDYSDITIS